MKLGFREFNKLATLPTTKYNWKSVEQNILTPSMLMLLLL